jgi:site-specific DNA-methyltransferase (adenine-specific)
MIDLRLGDCLEVMKEIPSKSIDAIICDLPYGTTACKWDSIIPFEPLWEQYNRVIKSNGAIVLFGSQPFTSALISSNYKKFKYSWVWNKVTARGHLVAKHRPLQQTEDIIVFGNSKHNYYPIMIDRPKNKWKKSKEFNKTDLINSNGKTEYKIYKTWYPKNLIEVSNANASNNKPLHPTQKPLELIEYLVKTYSLENDTILDNTMGSGTTMLACKNLNRNGIGIEKDPQYYAVAVARVDG